MLEYFEFLVIINKTGMIIGPAEVHLQVMTEMRTDKIINKTTAEMVTTTETQCISMQCEVEIVVMALVIAHMNHTMMVHLN